MISKWVVHKFGGTSVANAERYRAAAEIVLSQEAGERVAVVVSAMSGVTNGLIQSVELAASRDSSYLTKLQELKNHDFCLPGELTCGKASHAGERSEE